MTKYKKASSLGKAGSIGFNQKEAKEIRKNFIPVTNLDHLALYLDGTKFSPESFDRFFDSNLRKKGAQAFNLKWIKNGGAKVDQLALSIKNDVQGYNVKDESEIIADIQYLVTTYPAGFTEYYFEASQHNEDEYNDNANYSDMENEIEREQANEAFEAGLKKSLKPKIRLKRTVKTVTKTVTKRKTVNKTKQVYTLEFLAIKSLYNLNGKKITIKQLERIWAKVSTLVKRGNKNNHFQLLKTIKSRLELAIFKLDGNNITTIKKFEIQKDLMDKLTAIVTAPKVKQVTLGDADKGKEKYSNDLIIKIAKACHEANRKYCESIGDFSQKKWDNAEDWQKKSAIEGVKFAIENPNAPDSAQHDKWWNDKKADGWKYGKVKDAFKKTHPCMVPFNKLPKEQQYKDKLFRKTVKNFSSKKKSSLGSFTSEHKEAIKEAANDVKNAADLLDKAQKNKEAATKIAQLKKGLDKYTEIYLNLLAKTPKKQGLDRSQTSLFKKESKPQTSLFGDALHGIEQYTDAEMKELGISFSNSLNGIGKGKKSPYDIINEKLIALLKSGDLPWINQRKNAPIKGEDGMLRNYITKRPYSGVNVIMLNSFMEAHHNSFFLTKKQIEARGGKLNKGARGFQIIFTKKFTVTENKPATETKPATQETKQAFMLNTHIVYNSADTDLKPRSESTGKTEKEVIESCETIYPNMPKKPVLKFGGTKAFYVPAADYVQMPNQDGFLTLQGYYRTLFHELAHSTGHKSRLNRKGDSWSVNKRDYAIEELVAEIASSYICGYTGIYFANEQKHASYLNYYLKEMHGNKLEQYKADLVLQAQTDKTFLLHAIGAAQKAANYILSKQLKSLKKAKKPAKTDKAKLNGLGRILTKNDLSTIAKNAGASVKSPFQTMDKLVSGGTYQLEGERGKLLGNLGQVDCSITIRGDQGAGKSQLMWQLVDDFAEIGKNVAVVSPEMNGSSPTISKYRDKYIKPKNQNKVLFTDKKLTVKAIKDLSNAFDVVFVDSFNQLEKYEQSQFDWLCKQLPNKCIVGLFQSTTGGEMRGGNKPEFDAYVNIEVVKVDDSFINNYAVCTKNRFGGTGAKYNISTQKIMTPKAFGAKSTALAGVAKKRASKKIVKKATKSVEASKVLKLMDDDYSYQDALKLVLSNNKNIDKTKLEKELNQYI